MNLLRAMKRAMVETDGATWPAAELWHTDRGMLFIVVGWPEDTSFPHHFTAPVKQDGARWVGKGVIVRPATQGEIDTFFTPWESYRNGEGKEFNRASAWEYVLSYMEGKLTKRES